MKRSSDSWKNLSPGWSQGSGRGCSAARESDSTSAETIATWTTHTTSPRFNKRITSVLVQCLRVMATSAHRVLIRGVRGLPIIVEFLCAFSTQEEDTPRGWLRVKLLRTRTCRAQGMIHQVLITRLLPTQAIQLGESQDRVARAFPGWICRPWVSLKLNPPSSFFPSNENFRTDSSRQSVSLGGKPRLVRQSAFQDETQEPQDSRLNVRFLPTIPSAPDSSVQLDEEGDEPQSTAETPESVPLQIPEGNSSILSSPKKSEPPWT